METKECPGCAVEVNADAEVCPICGYEFPKQSKLTQIVAWVLIILIVLWLVL